MEISSTWIVDTTRHCAGAAIVAGLVLGAAESSASPELSAAAAVQSVAAPEVTETLVNAGGYRLNFRVIRGKGPVILLESGGGDDSSQWATLAPRLARETGATVVAYDRAGFGKSDLPETPYDLPDDTAAMWRGLGQLGLDRDLILVGHSYGGFLIRFYASERPASVRGLVFVDPFTVEFVDAFGLEACDRMMTLSFDASRPETLTKHQRADVRMMGAPQSNLAEKVALVRKAAAPRDIPARVLTSGTAWLEPDVQKTWHRAHERFTASMKGAQLVMAERSDHAIPERQPDLLASTVAEVVRLASK
jgi:pimeloyl-ACP methyl ester carboxylesterase